MGFNLAFKGLKL